MSGGEGSTQTTCIVAGGGPAGMMLGFLLARAGVAVTVLEKHQDFLRDFRGDTIHPSTLELMHELNILDDFLSLPHQEMHQLGANVFGENFPIADFNHLPTHCKFIAFMPQWDFLRFLADRGASYPNFHLMMRAEATDVLENDGAVCGVRVQTPGGEVELRAPLTVAADGRHSILRQRAGFVIQDYGAPMDVLWMRLPRHQNDSLWPLGSVGNGSILITINRDTYWQCAFVIAKGTFDEIKARGIQSLRDEITYALPALSDRVDALRNWNDVSLLTVKLDRLREWYRPGLLCIGDAAHAMSPIGGVGINLAIQDAVAAANILTRPLLSRSLRADDLRRVQERRMFPTRATQGVQRLIQSRGVRPLLRNAATGKPPWQLQLFKRFPLIRRLPAYMIGIGFRPEHIAPIQT